MTTKLQDKAINNIKRLAENLYSYHADKYEIKRFETRENEYFVDVIVEVGMKEDEEDEPAEDFYNDLLNEVNGK